MIQQFPQAFLHQPVSSQPKGGKCWWWLSAFYVLPCDIYKNNFWDKYIFSCWSLSRRQSLFAIKLCLSCLSRSVFISSFLKWNNVQIKEEIEPNHTCMYMNKFKGLQNVLPCSWSIICTLKTNAMVHFDHLLSLTHLM